jgi:hypothetical protein
MGEFADDLNVAIALREWDRAVELVEQGTFLLLAIELSHVSTGQAKLAAMPLLAAKLTPLTAELTLPYYKHFLTPRTTRRWSRSLLPYSFASMQALLRVQHFLLRGRRQRAGLCT